MGLFYYNNIMRNKYVPYDIYYVKLNKQFYDKCTIENKYNNNLFDVSVYFDVLYALWII